MSGAGDVLQVEGINAKGYGIIPKLVMQDKRLSSTSKAIYAYFCSYAGAGKTAFPSRAKIIADLGISKDSYYKHLDLLKNAGYIRAAQEKDKGGRFIRNLYTLVESIPCPKISDTVPCPSLPDTEKPDTAICIKSNSTKNNRRSSQSCRDGFPPNVETVSPEVIQDMVDVVHDQIEYSYFLEHRKADVELVDEIVNIIVDAMLGSDDYIRLDGEKKPRALVKQRLMELDAGCVEHVVGTFKGHTSPIKRKRQYLLTMLYNSRLELEAHYTNMVQSDLYGGASTSREQKNRPRW